MTLLCLCTILLALSACRKDEQISTDSSFLLEFSRDTLIFDTVFTTVGTATQALKVYNRGDQAIEISSLYLGEGNQSSYRMNVDGESGSSHDNVLIPGNDSIFIFVDVTIDPNDINSPLIETDSILFSINGNLQYVDLVAWGQDALFFTPTNLQNGLPPFTCLDGDCLTGAGTIDTTWTSLKPIVIYGYLIINEGDKLTIEAGTQIYFHEGSGLWVWEKGQLIVNGTADAPVVFQHDRQEMDYDDIPGQWDLIRINEGLAGEEHNNVLKHAIIKNSIIGIEAKPLTLQEEDIEKPTSENWLIMENCIVQQTSAFGVLARKYRIKATNCLFANAGQNVFGISGGGEYEFEHCTFGNYWFFSNRTEPAFYMSDLYRDEAGAPNQATIDSFKAINCIMYGNTFSEFLVELGPTQSTAGFDISHCLVRIDDDEMSVDDASVYTNMFDNPSVGPGFIFPSENDFHLNSSSFAIDAGSTSIVVGEDLDGALRDSPPDLGCYEYTE